MSKQKKEIVHLLSPVGRLVQGSVYVPQTKDMDGNLLVDDDGNPQPKYYFALAIKKGVEKHWNQTEWGKRIWQIGEENASISAVKRPDFAWKIHDGDNNTPNRNERRLCDYEGFPGNWIVRFNTIIAPELVNEHAELLRQDNFIQMGYFIQVYFSISYNNPLRKPNIKNGVYLNPEIVSFQAYGEPIQQFFRPDPKTVGFGGQPLPEGASATPISQLHETALAQNEAPEPYRKILDPENVTQSDEPPAPPAPPAPAVRRVTLDDKTWDLDAMLAKGWTEKALLDAGYVIS